MPLFLREKEKSLTFAPRIYFEQMLLAAVKTVWQSF